MTVEITKKGSSILSVIDETQKQYGETAACLGGKFRDVVRIPTGVFPFDLASGGGIPRGKISIFWGRESGGKTILLYLAIKMEQYLNPKMYNVIIDIEKSWDRIWALRLGLDVDRVVILTPTFAEEAVDMTEAAIASDDVSIVGVDSIAAMITKTEGENSAEKKSFGGNSLVVGSLMRKLLLGLTLAERSGRYPTPILINQMRTKIGVMFGSPEHQPGGWALKHASGLTCKVYSNAIIDNTVNSTLPAYKDTKVQITKYRVPIVSSVAEYKIAVIPHKGLKCGDVADWNTVSTYLRDMGMLRKAEVKSHGWELCDLNLKPVDTFKTLELCKQHIYGDPDLVQNLKELIIQAAVANIHDEVPDVQDDEEEKATPQE